MCCCSIVQLLWHVQCIWVFPLATNYLTCVLPKVVYVNNKYVPFDKHLWEYPHYVFSGRQTKAYICQVDLHIPLDLVISKTFNVCNGSLKTVDWTTKLDYGTLWELENISLQNSYLG